MNKQQLEALRADVVELEAGPYKVYRPAFSRNSADRTLLWGYDVDRRSFHVYLKDDLVHLVVYEYGATELQAVTEFAKLSDLSPNKRLYPEACDFEFCEFLKSQGVHLSFTTFNDRRESAQFYGRLAD